MADCDNPVTDTGRKNSLPLCDPAQACPVGIPDNTGQLSYVNGLPVFSLGAGIGTVPGGGDNCPPVPAPAISFVTGAENLGDGEGLFSQLVGGILQFFSLKFGAGFTVSNDGSNLLIDLIDSGVVSWDDILSKPAEFPPSAHTHTLADITDAGSAAGADSTDFATAAQGATADTALQPADVGTAAAANVGDFATAAQGSTADSAVQPADSVTTLNMNTDRLLGRTTALAGAVEEIIVGSGLLLSAGTITATNTTTGTVTATGGALTANSVVLGAGTTDTKVVAGVTTDGVAGLVLGVNATSKGSVKLFGNTSGDVTLAPNAIAGTAIALTLPATSGTVSLIDGHVIEDEGTPVTQRANMNFTGAGVAVTDAGGKTVVTIAGGGNVATDAIWDAAGDLAIGTGADTAAKLTMGSALQVLRVNAAGTALEYATPSGGGSLTLKTWDAMQGQPFAANYAVPTTRNNIYVLGFNDSTDYSIFFVGVMPEAAVLTGGVSVRIHWMAETATSGAVIWEASIERGTTDLDADSFDTIAFASGAANGTSGIPTATTISLTTIDSVAAGDLFRLKISRDANGTNGTDSMTGDAQLIAVELRGVA